jgi:hypothetical protein
MSEGILIDFLQVPVSMICMNIICNLAYLIGQKFI